MERIADRSVHVGTAFDGVATSLPDHASTIIVGSGIIGASIAYHLAERGQGDILVLEQNHVASGTTWHAAGLVSSLRGSAALTELANYGIDFYAELGDRSGVDVAFNQCGSLVVARTEGRLDELRYSAALARGAGIPVRLLTPEDVPGLWPIATGGGLAGAMLQPRDGHLNPGYAALAMLTLAHTAGARFVNQVRVSHVKSTAGRVDAVVTDRGTIRCDRVVLAAGLWTRDLAARSGINVPLYAAEHVHVRTEPMAGVEPTLPVLRDLDGYFYARHEAGRLLVGAFEPAGKPRALRDIATAGHVEFSADWDHFAPVRRNAEFRIPSLSGVRYDRFINAPEAFTPDANFCLGEALEVEGVYVAAGFNSQGVIYAPGAGRALADWIVSGSPTFDASAVDIRRFSAAQGNRRYLHQRTREALGRLYAMHWPHLQPTTARGLRRTPLHQRLVENNACFGETVGWERANWFAPPGTRPEYKYSYGRQNWFDVVGEEHRAARETAGLFDLSSFTKIEIAGSDALDVLQRFCTADIDVAVGRIKYTLMLNQGGGIELDGTVIRTAVDRFIVITPAASQSKTLGMLSRLTRGHNAAAFDATSGLATIAIMGPESRRIVQRISPDDWSDEAHRYMRARRVEIGSTNVIAARVSFVGELGYELYLPSDQAVTLYDDLTRAGKDLGLRPAGYHALDSLRSEKGYRHLGHDIGPTDTPEESGLAFTLSMSKSPGFIGREAVAERTSRRPRRRQVFVALRDPDPVFVHDEPVLLGDRVVGRMTSGSYGYTLGRACGLAFVDAEIDDAAQIVVDCGGTLVEAELSQRPFYDPDGLRLRG